MMTTNTTTRLETLVKFIVTNAHYTRRQECIDANQPDLFNLIKFAVRKEQKQLTNALNINVTNICKTTRQLNWVANEAEYNLKKLFKKDPQTAFAWTGIER